MLPEGARWGSPAGGGSKKGWEPLGVLERALGTRPRPHVGEDARRVKGQGPAWAFPLWQRSAAIFNVEKL